jgi:hypothetical protein
MPICHLGVSDSFLARLQIDLPESFMVRCSPEEEESLSLLEQVFPDFREIVGPKCAQTLERKHKIEIEAVVSTMGTVAGLLQPAIGPDI